MQRDALGIIAHKLSEGPPAKAGRDLANASMTNRALRAAVAGLDEHAGWCLTQMRKARQLAGNLLSGNPNASQARLCLPVLGFLNPQKQAQLVRTLLDSANHGPNGWVYGPATFEKFVPQLANLHKPLRTELAIEATCYTEDYSVSAAINGLSRGLAHFDKDSIKLLLNKATSLRDITARTNALSGLSRGLAHMDTTQRQRLLQAAMDIQDTAAQDRVNASLCAQLTHLPPGERDRLFDWAISVPNNSRMWPEALGGLPHRPKSWSSGRKRPC